MVLRRVLALLLPYWLACGALIVCICGSAGLGLLPAYLTSQIIDRAIGGRQTALLIELTALLILTGIANGLISVAQAYLNNVVSLQLSAGLREMVYEHLLQVPLGFFHQVKLGDLLARFNSDIAGIQMFATTTFVGIIANILILISTFAYMVSVNWPLTFLAVFILPLCILPTRRVGKVSRNVSQQTQEQTASMHSVLVETLGIDGLLLVKHCTQQEHEQQRFRDRSRQLLRLQLRQGMIGRWLFMVTGLFSSVGPATAYLLGGLEMLGIIPGHLTIGELVAFIALFNRMYLPATQLLGSWVDIQRASALFERIFALLDEPAEQSVAISRVATLKRQQPSLMVGHIEFDQVSFAYSEQQWAVRDISFMVHPGQMVALVGPSGAGKTTLMHLVPRIYEIAFGSILIDGTDVRAIPLQYLRSHIGVVAQDSYLFHASIRDNIAYGRLTATDEDVIAAAKAAYLHDIIMSLPEKYNTMVGERGFRLSGCEKQRIAIARMLLKDPRILILDEATSALDGRTEALVQSALERLMQNRTTLVIAHRFSTIRSASAILVMDHGHIVERGTHEELMRRGELYSRLYHYQTRRNETATMTDKVAE